MESNEYRKRLIVHLSLPEMDHSKDYYIAYCHWHPKILELHHKARQILPKTMFPRTITLDMGKELSFHKSDGVQEAKGSPMNRFYNVPSATFDFYCGYLSTTIVDKNITEIASGTLTSLNSLRESLSTPSLRNGVESGSSDRLLSVKQKSALAAAKLVVEERIMEEGKTKKKLEAAEEKKINNISTMNDAQKKLYYLLRAENSSLKRKLDEMAQKF